MTAVVYDSDVKLKTQPARELNGKAVVNIRNGEKLGNISEVLFDPDGLRVAALLMNQGGLLNRDFQAVPAESVRVWGKDVILVENPNILSGGRLSRLEKFVKLSDQLNGRYVVGLDGTRIGQVNDLLIDDQGRLAGYDLSQVFVEGPLARSKRIPVGATYSMGKDVLVVDPAKF